MKDYITHTCITHLSLNEVSGDNFTPVTIEEGKSGAEGRGRYSPENSLSNNAPPTGLRMVDSYGIGWVLHRESNWTNVPLLKKSSKRRDSSRGFFSYAEVISPRKTLYMHVS